MRSVSRSVRLGLCVTLVGMAAFGCKQRPQPPTEAATARPIAPSPPDNPLLRGYKLALVGDYPGAIAAFMAAQQAEPGQGAAFLQLSNAQLLNGDLEPALASAKQAVAHAKLAGVKAASYYTLARVEEARGNSELARKAYVDSQLRKSWLAEERVLRLSDLRPGAAEFPWGAVPKSAQKWKKGTVLYAPCESLLALSYDEFRARYRAEIKKDDIGAKERASQVYGGCLSVRNQTRLKTVPAALRARLVALHDALVTWEFLYFPTAAFTSKQPPHDQRFVERKLAELLAEILDALDKNTPAPAKPTPGNFVVEISRLRTLNQKAAELSGEVLKNNVEDLALFDIAITELNHTLRLVERALVDLPPEAVAPVAEHLGAFAAD